MFVNFVKSISISCWTLLIVTLFSVIFSTFFVNWIKFNSPFYDDVDQYYCYLISLFKHHDLYFEKGYYGFWLSETSTHHFVPKVTYGMSLFYFPFFLIAELFSKCHSTGYEPIYSWAIHIGCTLYGLLGLLFCRKILLLFFSEKTTAISLSIMFFGTNLFCYILINPELTHSILFLLISMFVYYTIKWQKSSHKKYFFIICFLFGIISLIRPTELSLLIFPLLIGVSNLQSVKEKLNNVLKLKYNLLFGLILFILPLFPQLLYWKIQSGQWLYFSYGNDEHFFWKDPQLINVMISYRKGWLVYSPLMALSLMGFIQLFKQRKDLFLGIFFYFLINLYLISTWWDWSFGGSFGMRALVHVGAILIIPLAYTIQWIIGKCNIFVLKLVVYITIIFFCALNVFQSNLYKHGIISFDGMTKEAYWYTFLKKKYSKSDLLYLKTLIKHPDYEMMKKGKRDN